MSTPAAASRSEGRFIRTCQLAWLATIVIATSAKQPWWETALEGPDGSTNRSGGRGGPDMSAESTRGHSGVKASRAIVMAGAVGGILAVVALLSPPRGAEIIMGWVTLLLAFNALAAIDGGMPNRGESGEPYILLALKSACLAAAVGTATPIIGNKTLAHFVLGALMAVTAAALVVCVALSTGKRTGQPNQRSNDE